MSNSMHVNIANNRWALKVLYNPISSNQSTYIIQTIPSSRTARPQTIIEINSSIQTNSLIVVRQHLLNDTIATIIQSTISSLDNNNNNNQILTADIVAHTIQYNQIHNSSQCSICLGDFNITDMILQLICKHIYHRECLLHWLQTHYRCPYCRFLVYQQPVTPHIFLIRQTIT
ncbi:unnamed protein product [Rotaria sp. Silwood1]|nr:unnamed protein product [Rotaria sp. Silwood1]